MGIDGYCWMHKAIYCDDMDLAFNPESTSYLYFLKSKVNLLLKHGIIPVMIFDGNRLPAKNAEEEHRQFKREEKQKHAYQLLSQGKTEEAKLRMICSLDITPEMVHKFSKFLTEMGVEFIVAPYEADAQLAYLDYINYIDAVCTEDSDLIAYGCKKIVYKLDSRGFCQEIKTCRVFEPANRMHFAKFSHDMFLQFCILSGCDFFKISGISTNKAYKLIQKCMNFWDAIPAIETMLKRKLTSDVSVQFEKAYMTFKHQVVYCPIEKCMKHLTKTERSDAYLGTIQPEGIAVQIASASIHPFSLITF